MSATLPYVPNQVGFPEHQFLPLGQAAESYFAAVERGRAAMRQARIVICGLARNVAAHLPLMMARVGRLGDMFADYRVLIYENDSVDETPASLERWAETNERVTVISQRLGKPQHASLRCSNRADDMAAYRNRCQQEVQDRWSDFDYVCLIDTDLAGGFSYDGIAHSFGSQPWDSVGSYGIIYQRQRMTLNRALHYDVWAYRPYGDYDALECRDGNLLSWQRGEGLVPVYSCFGGLGLYRMPAWLAARYAGGDCEHVALHREMRARGYDRQYLNPNQIVLYGRKVKRFDRTLQFVNRFVQAAAAFCMMA